MHCLRPRAGDVVARRLWLHRSPFDLPEAAVEVDLGFGPARLHQRNPLVEPRHQRARIHFERREPPRTSAGRHADVDASAAEPVDARDAFGEVDRTVQRSYEHRASQPQPVGAGRGVGHRLERAQGPGRAERLLLRPSTLEPELLGSLQMPAKPGAVELLVAHVLGHRDREPHVRNGDTNLRHRFAGAVRL